MTTDTLATFFKTLSIDSTSDSAKFVYYHTATGEIQKISNHYFPIKGCECLEVLSDKVVDILLGRKDLSSYRIMFNIKTRELELQENSPHKIVNITDKLHNVPKNSRDADLIIKCGTENWTV